MLVIVCVSPAGLASVGHVVRVGCVSPVVSFALVGLVVLVGRVAHIGLFGIVARVARAAPFAC
jgi:hypothetical protein